MFDASVPVILIPSADASRLYDALLKISIRERKKRLSIYIWLNGENIEKQVEKLRSIISLNHILTLSFFVLRSNLEVLKKHNPNRIYIVFPETRKEVALSIAGQLSEMKTEVVEVEIPGL
ncbi:hypothetical protein IMZ38_05120 [Thermosphaera chiliense]|uniref:Uncharacterized protein n=1 Tax=Thermosphaera chiliense TaxID=3402707 RepID=A0A7M1UP33_9CREN|nr:hypothetical protein [Thermosphaera aggregans]QOR94025.1 hypothetical protein IMZ38_05120 [Thermosphaera aggregans]